MVFSCLSCLWPNQNVHALQIGPDPAASRRADTEDVALSVQDAYNFSQARPPEGGDRAPPLSSRVISPLPSTELMSDDRDMDTSVSWTLRKDSPRPVGMEISQTPPAPPSTPVIAVGLNSVDGREDADSLFVPNNGSDEESVESVQRKGWSFSQSRRSEEDSSQQVQWNPFSSMQIAPLFPTATPVINGRGEDSDREDSDSLFVSKDRVEEDSPPQKKEISTPMPFSPRLRPYNNEKMTAFPSLSQSNNSFGDAPPPYTVWQIHPRPSQRAAG